MILPVGSATYYTCFKLFGWTMIKEPLYRRPLVWRAPGKHPVTDCVLDYSSSNQSSV